MVMDRSRVVIKKIKDQPAATTSLSEVISNNLLLLSVRCLIRYKSELAVYVIAINYFHIFLKFVNILNHQAKRQF